VAPWRQWGFNPQSAALWAYHWSIYWGLTQKIYRLEFDPEYTGYTCSDPLGIGRAACRRRSHSATYRSDALYDYRMRIDAEPRHPGSHPGGGEHREHPAGRWITLHGDQDSLLPIATDSDIYSQLVARAHKSSRYVLRCRAEITSIPVRRHTGVDSYGDSVLRPMLPCVRAAVDELAAW